MAYFILFNAFNFNLVRLILCSQLFAFIIKFYFLQSLVSLFPSFAEFIQTCCFTIHELTIFMAFKHRVPLLCLKFCTTNPHAVKHAAKQRKETQLQILIPRELTLIQLAASNVHKHPRSRSFSLFKIINQPFTVTIGLGYSTEITPNHISNVTQLLAFTLLQSLFSIYVGNFQIYV